MTKDELDDEIEQARREQEEKQRREELERLREELKDPDGIPGLTP